MGVIAASDWVCDDHGHDMEIAGSVSGGCIEGAVIEAGLEAIQSGEGQRLDFGVADETAWEVGLSCGGQISVLVCLWQTQGCLLLCCRRLQA